MFTGINLEAAFEAVKKARSGQRLESNVESPRSNGVQGRSGYAAQGFPAREAPRTHLTFDLRLSTR
jgi:hypothetical protein